MNGDGEVDIADIVIVAGLFGTEQGEPKWNPITDLNNDKVIDIADIVIVAKEFGNVG
jgi:hypothetical protein